MLAFRRHRDEFKASLSKMGLSLSQKQDCCNGLNYRLVRSEWVRGTGHRASGRLISNSRGGTCGCI